MVRGGGRDRAAEVRIAHLVRVGVKIRAKIRARVRGWGKG